jgi:alpha-L-rhamnosidase
MKIPPFHLWSSAPPLAWRRRWLAGAGCWWLGALSLAPSAALADNPASIASIASYFTGPLVRPTSVESTSGQVTNAEALVAGQKGFATLTWDGTGSAPLIVLDYGRDVGGIPVFDVVSVSNGTPTLRAIYSEGRPYLLPNGDGAATPRGLPPASTASPGT